MDDLAHARAALCDLLLGRRLRIRAAEFLESALYLESCRHPAFILDELMVQAAHIEWMACLCEQGRIAWGGRFNRCGYQPVTDDDD